MGHGKLPTEKEKGLIEAYKQSGLSIRGIGRQISRSEKSIHTKEKKLGKANVQKALNGKYNNNNNNNKCIFFKNMPNKKFWHIHR